MNQFKLFVASELSELESRDADQLFECISDNLTEMGVQLNDSLNAELYGEIELQLSNEVSK